MHVKSLKQWIRNTKRLFKIHNDKLNERKITEFFQNNDRPVSKIGNKKTIKQSEQPTTNNYNNNKQHISKERNIPYNSTYYGVSKDFKQIENTNSEEEIYQFCETSSESGTKSEGEKNNINKTKKLIKNSNTKYGGIRNITESNKNKKSRYKNNNDSKNNGNSSHNNNTIDKNSRRTYSNNNNSNSKNKLIQNHKMEGQKLHAGETNSNYSSGSSMNSSTLTTFKIKKENDITT